jgi:hypothetical protein
LEHDLFGKPVPTPDHVEGMLFRIMLKKLSASAGACGSIDHFSNLRGLLASRTLAEVAGRRRAGAFRTRAVVTAATAVLEAVAALSALAVLEVATARRLRLSAGDERGQAVDVAVIRLHLWLRLLRLRLRTIFAELWLALRLALIRLLARRIWLLLLRRLRRETRLGAEGGKVAFAFLTGIVAHFAVGTLLLLILLRLILPELLLRGGDDAEVVFGVLVIVFGGNRVARALRIARKLHVFFGEVGRGAADLDLRTVGFVDPGHRILATPVVIAVVAVPAAAAAAVPHTLVLAVSHVVFSHQPRIVALNLQSLSKNGTSTGTVLSPSPMH